MSKKNENIPEISRPPPKTIKLRIDSKEMHLFQNSVLCYGTFQQYVIGEDIEQAENHDIKLISENGLKVLVDLQDTILKEINAKKFFRKKGFLDFSPTLNCNIFVFKKELISLYKYKQTYRYAPQLPEQYTCFENMLSGLEYLHNFGFIHGCLNLYSYFIDRINKTTNAIEKIYISDLDLCTRWNKNNYFNRLEKFDPRLKEIYEKRLQRSIKNTGFCALKQYTGDKISLKNDIESWYYVCIYIMEDSSEWQKAIDDEDSMFVMKQNMRQPSYSGYDRISTRFTEILYFLDQMKDDSPDYKFIKKKVISASKHPEPNEVNLKNDAFSEPSDFLYLANDSRIRRKPFRDEYFNILRLEVEKIEMKDKNEKVNQKKVKEKNKIEAIKTTMLSPPDKVSVKTFLKTSYQTTKKETGEIDVNISKTKNINTNEVMTKSKKKNRAIVNAASSANQNNFISALKLTTASKKEKKDKNNFLLSVKKRLRKIFKKSTSK